ncbi:MAG: hypothetical protein JSS99_14115 [Actinobacteria bacterium]|nr:hypothetical protein [Actinomycetota bacterium]
MDPRRKRIAAIGAVVALAVTGGGVAYAAATGGDHRDAVLRDAAQRLNVTPGQLRSALAGAIGDQLDQAVRAGRLTQAQADRIKQQIARHGVPLGGPGLDGHGFGGPMGGPGHGPFGAGLDAAATYLGLTRAQLGRALMSGRSLADVARAQGKSVAGLEQALIDDATSQLDRAVTDRRLTSAQRDAILRDLRAHVADLVNGTGPGPGRFGHRDRDGDHMMGPGGPPPGGFPGP